MTLLIVAVVYVVGMYVGGRCAARFLARINRRYDLPDEAWDGFDWFIVAYTAVAWPIAVPIGHVMTWRYPGRSLLWLQRHLGGPR